MDSSASRTIRASEVFGLAVVSCLLLAASTAPAHTIVVPADQPTIQQAVWASSEGDTVLVMPGTYVENIVIDRDIAVRSAEGPAVTIIDGSQPANPDSASVVSFRSYADGSIEGFDIRNGTGRSAGSQRQGGGILVNNWFEPSIVYGPLIMGNWIHGNWLDGDITDRGAGVEVVGAARILNNRLYDNGFIADGYGAALSVTREWGGHQEPVVFQANEVFDNHGYPAVPGRNSGAVRIMDTVCTENVIACNSGGRGAALIGGGQITSNTIAGNWSFTQEAAVLLGMRADAANCWSVLFQNNNVTDNVGPGVECLYVVSHLI